jgi:AcrR family transcriptional regulator
MTLAGRRPTHTRSDWLEAAGRSLIAGGISGLRVDRLAKMLGVTRGGFYHCFSGRKDLLTALLDDWEKSCLFLPKDSPPSDKLRATDWLNRTVHRLIESDGYDHRLDLAIREWGRSAKQAAWAIERVDQGRIEALRQCFAALGHEPVQAIVRARIFYHHQIGYFAAGVMPNVGERRRTAAKYLEILCGPGIFSEQGSSGPGLYATALEAGSVSALAVPHSAIVQKRSAHRQS